jgi:PAS domain-containing protein
VVANTSSFIMTIENLTHVKEALEAQNSIFELGLAAIVMIDERGTIDNWNQAATDMFGYSKEEVRGAEMVVRGALIRIRIVGRR